MAANNANPFAIAAYELGCEITEFVQFAEWLWCDWETSKLNPPPYWLRRMLRCILVIKQSVDVLDVPNTHTNAETFKKALGTFLAVFFVRFSEDNRLNLATKCQNADQEFAFDAQVAMIKQSPLKTGPWMNVESALQQFLESMDKKLRALVEIGRLLTSEIYPTIAGGQRTRDEHRDEIHFEEDVTNQLRANIAVASEEYPSVGNIVWDLVHPQGGWVGEIKRLHTQLKAALKDPETAPGYLGLTLNPRTGCILRGGTSSELRRGVLWKLLRKLQTNKEDWYSSEMLQNVTTIDSDAALKTAITDLRKALRPLGINIETRRREGWRLTEINSPQRVAKKRRGRRK